MDRHDLLFALGRPFAPAYAGIMALRAKAYRKGLFAVHHAGVPVISIGNLTWGGTGKTPMVIAVAEFCLRLGFRPAIVSRGYGAASPRPVNTVSDGRRILLDAAAAGDEPLLLAERLPGVPVLTGVRRPAAARRAVELFAPDLLLLDDGFQHLALARDLDIVLLNGGRPLGNGRVFPGGPLREGVGALRRAHCLVATGSAAAALDAALPARAGFAAIPRFGAAYRPRALLTSAGEPLPLESLAGKRPLAFCGLGSPDSFRRSLAEIGIVPVDFIACRDHRRYVAADLVHLAERCRQQGGDCLLATEKDLVKLRRFPLPLPLYALRVVLDPEPAFFAFLEERLQALVGVGKRHTSTLRAVS
ncbi:MAG: tetraacyldisaccharide 4'-kinase [Thermodesulfobacteriota bacterium]